MIALFTGDSARLAQKGEACKSLHTADLPCLLLLLLLLLSNCLLEECAFGRACLRTRKLKSDSQHLEETDPVRTFAKY